MRVTKLFRWEAAHRLLGHQGKCRYLHGHGYAAEVTLESDALSSLGMVIDFQDVKDTIGKFIDEVWDHNMILHPEDPLLSLLEGLSREAQKEIIGGGKDIYSMPNIAGQSSLNPTAENLAALLHWVSGDLLAGKHAKVVHVRVYETPTCWADYDGKDK